MEFSEKLLQLRRAKGLSQEQLAEQLQVSRQAVSKWETGEALPETDKLLRLGDFFGVTLDSLLREGLRPAPLGADGPAHRADASACAADPALGAAGAASGNAVPAHKADDPALGGAAPAAKGAVFAGAAGVPLQKLAAVRILCWALLLLGAVLVLALGNDGSQLWYWPLVRMVPGLVLQLAAVTLYELAFSQAGAPAAADRPLFWSLALPLAAPLPILLLGRLAVFVTRSMAFGWVVMVFCALFCLCAAAPALYRRHCQKTGKADPFSW